MGKATIIMAGELIINHDGSQQNAEEEIMNEEDHVFSADEDMMEEEDASADDASEDAEENTDTHAGDPIPPISLPPNTLTGEPSIPTQETPVNEIPPSAQITTHKPRPSFATGLGMVVTVIILAMLFMWKNPALVLDLLDGSDGGDAPMVAAMAMPMPETPREPPEPGADQVHPDKVEPRADHASALVAEAPAATVAAETPTSLIVSAMGNKPACTAECTWGNLTPSGFPKTEDDKRTVVCGTQTWLVASAEKIEEGDNRLCYTATKITAP